MDNLEKEKRRRQKRLKEIKKGFEVSPWTLKKPMYLKKNDNRYKKHVRDLKKYGFSNSETWCLYSCICQFILPRLKRFRDIKAAYPMGLKQEEWTEMLDKMIFSFEWAMLNDEGENLYLSEEEQKANWEKYKEGMNLFSEWFMALWW